MFLFCKPREWFEAKKTASAFCSPKTLLSFFLCLCYCVSKRLSCSPGCTPSFSSWKDLSESGCVHFNKCLVRLWMPGGLVFAGVRPEEVGGAAGRAVTAQRLVLKVLLRECAWGQNPRESQLLREPGSRKPWMSHWEAQPRRLPEPPRGES